MAITSPTQHFHVTNWSAVLEYLLEPTVVNSMFCTVNSYFNSELYATICPKILCSPNFGHYLNSTAIRLLLTNDLQNKLYFQSVTLTMQYSLYRFNPWSLLCVFNHCFTNVLILSVVCVYCYRMLAAQGPGKFQQPTTDSSAGTSEPVYHTYVHLDICQYLTTCCRVMTCLSLRCNKSKNSNLNVASFWMKNWI